jgi:hypothetical protein
MSEGDGESGDRVPGLAVGMRAPGVVALPGHALTRGGVRGGLGSAQLVTRAKEGLVLAAQSSSDSMRRSSGANSSSSARRCGTIMQIGSSTPNRTVMNLRVNFRLMLKLALDQSVSTRPSRGETASFG